MKNKRFAWRMQGGGRIQGSAHERTVQRSTVAAGHSSLQCCRHKLITEGGLTHRILSFASPSPPPFAIKLHFFCSFPLRLSFYFHEADCVQKLSGHQPPQRTTQFTSLFPPLFSGSGSHRRTARLPHHHRHPPPLLLQIIGTAFPLVAQIASPCSITRAALLCVFAVLFS